MKSGDVVEADLVIDASGPRTHVRKWLAEGGYKEPRSVNVDPKVGYLFSILDVPQEVRCANRLRRVITLQNSIVRLFREQCEVSRLAGW